jgi:hypothetical protein
METVGRRPTLTLALPTAASTATLAGSIVPPRASTSSPACPSAPWRAMCAPVATGSRISTRRPPSIARVFSTGCTAVAPAGTGAPVITCTAWPGGSGASGHWPARI